MQVIISIRFDFFSIDNKKVTKQMSNIHLFRNFYKSKSNFYFLIFYKEGESFLVKSSSDWKKRCRYTLFWVSW